MRETIKAFNSVAGSYDDWYSHPQGAQVLKAELELLERRLPPCGVGLEVGAGTGAFAESLRCLCREIVCLEPSPEMTSKARGRGLLTVIGVGDQPPFRKSVLDYAYMSTVVEFLGDPVKVFLEIKELVKTEAPLIILFINSESAWGALYKELGSKGDLVFRHARLLSLPEMAQLLSEAGYLVDSSLGTLTTSPMEPQVGAAIVAPSKSCGVIAVKAKRVD